MAQKPKAGAAADKVRSAAAKQKAQSARFIETARTIGIDESGKDFDQAIRRLIPPKRRTKA